jgi:hypothetical protein
LGEQVFSDFLAALVMQGSKVALLHSGLLSDVSGIVPTSQKSLVLEISPPTSEEIVVILARKFPTISCAISGAEGRFNSFRLKSNTKTSLLFIGLSILREDDAFLPDSRRVG